MWLQAAKVDTDAASVLFGKSTAKKAKTQQNEKALAELKAFELNDATSAFADLIADQEIELFCL